MPGFVYILKNKDNRFYIGSTDNLERRFYQHRNKYTHTLKRLGDFTIALIQKFDTLKEARNIELRLKKLKRKDYIEKIVKDGYIKIK
jgi:predicted GIY-YIG superfamily endonuclease